MKRLMLVCLIILSLLPITALAEETFTPQGNYRVFCADGLYGVQTLDGETVIPAQFAGIQPFTGDLCIVEGVTDEECCIGLWRLSTGEELLPCDYENIEITDTAVIVSTAFSDEDDYGFRSRLFDPEAGRMVLDDPEIDEIWSIEDGRIFEVEYLDPTGDEIVRLVAPDGTLLLDADLWLAECTSASHGIVTVIKADIGFFQYYNTTTCQWFREFYDLAWPFADGYAPVCPAILQDAYYVIDETGTIVTPPYQKIATDAYDIPQYGQGVFAVQQEDGWYVIRVSSEAEPETLLGPVQCKNDPSYLGNQVFALPVDDGTLIFSGAENRLVMLHGITVHDYDSFIANCTVIHGDRKEGFLFDDLSVIEPAYDDCVEFLGDYGFVEIDGLWYPIDRSGHIDESVSYPDVAISDDCTYYVIEYESDDVLCLNPDLQPISHRSFCEHG